MMSLMRMSMQRNTMMQDQDFDGSKSRVLPFYPCFSLIQIVLCFFFFCQNSVPQLRSITRKAGVIRLIEYFVRKSLGTLSTYLSIIHTYTYTFTYT